MRLIDADALIDVVDGDLLDSVAEGKCIEKIMDAPTIDAVPVKHGRWIEEPNCMYRCSNCGDHYPSIRGYMYYDYCPSCGARMDGEEK